jgi:hypothetical protein
MRGCTVADSRPPEDHITALLRQLDDLLSEAAKIRENIDRAMDHQAELPFWPDRRVRQVPVDEERRHRG